MRKIYFLCFLISFASQNANAQKTENYLPNANFEIWVGTSLSSWSLTNTAVSSTITQETTNKITGSTNSIKYDPTVASQGVLGNSSVITIDTAGKYYFGIWIKTDSGAKIKPGIKIVRDAANIYIGNTYTAPDTDWHYVVFYYDYLVGDQVTCRLVPQASGINTTFYLDDASFNEGITGGNLEWDVTNGVARTYANFWATQSYNGSGTYGTLSENTNPSYVKSGYKSISLETNSDASNTQRGVLVLKDNNTWGNRYVHPATTRKYQASAWVYATGTADIILNTKAGTTNYFTSHTITANTWTQIFSNVIELDAADDGDEVYPIIQFKTPSITHYVDDVYLNWDGIKWEGGTSSDWDTASNWSSNMVPNSKSVVTIPSGLSNYPTAASAVTVSSVDMAAGTSLISTSTFSGTVKYTRTLADTADDWYLVSSPVDSQDINVFIAREGLASSGNNIGLTQRYNTGADTWTYYQSDASGSGDFVSGKGYAIKLASEGDIYFEGNIRNTDVTRTLALSANAYNLVANPYTSYMDTAAMLTANTGVLDTETIWVWNSSTGSYDTKVTVDAYKLAPAQGFFVKSDGQAGNLALNQAYEVHNSSDTFQRTEPRPEIHLTLSDGTLSRLAKIYYINVATTGFDNGYDGEMFGGISNEFAIYSHLVSNGSGIDLAVQSLPTNNYENMVIPVGLIASATEEITFTADVMNLPPDIKVFLEDRLQNTFTRLDEENTKYEVTLAETNGVGRFFIHTTQSVLSVSSDALLTSISVYKLNNSKVRIAGLSQGKTTVKLFNILGKQLINTSFAGNGVNDISLPKLAPGVYIVNVNMETGQLNKKIIIE